MLFFANSNFSDMMQEHASMAPVLSYMPMAFFISDSEDSFPITPFSNAFWLCEECLRAWESKSVFLPFLMSEPNVLPFFPLMSSKSSLSWNAIPKCCPYSFRLFLAHALPEKIAPISREPEISDAVFNEIISRYSFSELSLNSFTMSINWPLFTFSTTSAKSRIASFFNSEGKSDSAIDENARQESMLPSIIAADAENLEALSEKMPLTCLFNLKLYLFLYIMCMLGMPLLLSSSSMISSCTSVDAWNNSREIAAGIIFLFPAKA